MMLAPYGETITRLQPGVINDPYSGKPGPDWNNPIRTEIPGCIIYPTGRAAAETADVGRPEQVVDTLTVLLPPDASLDSSDRVEWDGNEYEVLGNTFQFKNPFTGWTPGGQAIIRLTKG